PVMDGYEATRRIKSLANGEKTVIIALTASAFEHERSKALDAGCDDYVSKPVRESTIFGKLAQHLGIQFIYEEQPGAAKTADEVELTPTMLASLPADWLSGLQQAAEVGDAETVNEIIVRI